MSGTSKKVEKLKKPFSVNIGMVVFGIIFVYITINVLIYLTKDQYSISQVQAGSIVDSENFSGLIIRDEKVVTAQGSGYINYLVADNSKVGKDANAYLIDSEGSFTEQMKSGTESLKMTSSDYADIRDTITSYKLGFTDSQFSEVYYLKHNLQSISAEIASRYTTENIAKDSVADITEDSTDSTTTVDETSAANVNETETVNNMTNDCTIVKSDDVGIVTYAYDGMESLSVEDVDESSFSKSSYEKKQLNPFDYVESGQPVYKVTTNDEWRVLIQLDEDQQEKLKDKKYVTVNFLKDNLSELAQFQIIQQNGGVYGELTMNDYMVRYLSDRYVDLEIIIEKAEGLKIPTSALTQKDFYKIPYSSLWTDESTNERGFYVDGVDEETNEAVIKKETCTIYYINGNNDTPIEERFCYVDKRAFEFGANIYSDEAGTSAFRIGTTGQLQGAYNINKGYAVFEIVEVLKQNNEYCVIADNMNYSLSIYDNIILDSTKVNENQIIY